MLLHPYRFGPTGPSDPFFSNVVLLMDGQSLTDQSSFHHTVTPQAGALGLSTDQAKFGTTSYKFTGTANSLIVINGPASTGAWTMGTSDFTIEAWWMPTLLQANLFMGIWNATSSQFNWGLGHGHTGVVNPPGSCRFVATGTAGYTFPNARDLITTSNCYVVNTWHHVVVARTGTNYYLFINGVSFPFTNVAGGASVGIDISNVGNIELALGASSPADTSSTKGYLGPLRITKGVNRYGTTNFTPPTGPFPTH